MGVEQFGDANCEESIVSPPKGDMAQNLEQTTLENLEHIRRETPEAQVSNEGDEHDVVPHIGVMPEPFNALEPLRSEPANADLPEPINTVEPLRSEPANADLPEPINTVEPLRSEPANADPVQVSTPRESAVVDGKGENSQGMEDNFRYVSFEDIVNVASSAVKESTVSQTPPIAEEEPVVEVAEVLSSLKTRRQRKRKVVGDTPAPGWMLYSGRNELPFGSRKDESDWDEQYRRMCPFHYFKSKIGVNFWKKFINPQNLPASRFRPTG